MGIETQDSEREHALTHIILNSHNIYFLLLVLHLNVKNLKRFQSSYFIIQ